jgi:hypothetical protein
MAQWSANGNGSRHEPMILQSGRLSEVIAAMVNHPVLSVPPIQFVTAFHRLVKIRFSKTLRKAQTASWMEVKVKKSMLILLATAVSAGSFTLWAPRRHNRRTS